MKLYKIVVEDSFLTEDPGVFYADSPSQAVNYITHQNKQLRFACVDSKYSVEKRPLYLVASAFNYTHEKILQAATEDGLIQKNRLEDLIRMVEGTEVEGMMAYCPIDDLEAKNESNIKSFIEDRWHSYLVFKDFILGNKDLYNDAADGLIACFKQNHSFIGSTKNPMDLLYFYDNEELPAEPAKKKYLFI